MEVIVGESQISSTIQAVSSAKIGKTRNSPTIRSFPSANQKFIDESLICDGEINFSQSIRGIVGEIEVSPSIRDNRRTKSRKSRI
ncbi:hypothetical protein [Nosocomiicoccus sp. HMSC09A07]|uniref:hypothetical protein n=1 Tax=Nosocomiicoccus sp. HMSC09A07 TaxID=1581145 RepID=UPI0008A404DC|nr:hypothetical protein [Nosocomiicoccus sp. HMSC09A07]